jgi:hypothetical protein
MRSMTSGCVIDQWPEHLQSLSVRKKLDMANVYAIRAIGTSSTDLREDETIGHLIAASMANGELDRHHRAPAEERRQHRDRACGLQASSGRRRRRAVAAGPEQPPPGPDRGAAQLETARRGGRVMKPS